jgi:cytoskeletal protein RodZ
MANTIQSIGERLRDERKKQGLSIEDVAHATRIHADTLLNLEADDYSAFASITYAKSFLKKYSSHLGVDASEALEQFANDATSPIVGGANYIRSVVDAIEPLERISGFRGGGNFAQVADEPSKRKASSQNGGPPIILGMFLLVLLAAIAVLIIVGNGADTIDDAKRNLSETFGIGEKSDDAETKNSTSAAEVKNRPGTRIAPAAPLTRSVNPKPEPQENHDLDRFAPGGAPFSTSAPPLAQARPNEKKTPPVAKPIRANPIVATPVVLPDEGAEQEEEEQGSSETSDGEGESEDDTTEPEQPNVPGDPSTTAQT